MGPYLSHPITEKQTTEDESNQYLRFSFAEMQGWRNTMEDSHIANLNIGDDVAIFGVFDGHGGHEVAKFVQIHFIEELKKNNNFKNKQFDLALQETFLKMDELMLKKEGLAELLKLKNNNNSEYQDDDIKQIYAGCTANVLLIYKRQQIFVANAGDSRTVISSKNQAIEMSIDHKPENPDERNRIQKAGGFISDGRVNGNLNLSRALGDFEYKKGAKTPEEFIITAFPEVKKRDLTADDQFILMGCDGIWECMSNQQLINFCQERINKNLKLKDILVELLDKIVAKDTSEQVGCDNMTTILIQLK